MEPPRKIIGRGGQDMLGIQNDHHFGPEVKYLMVQPNCLKSFLTNSFSRASRKNLHTTVLRKSYNNDRTMGFYLCKSLDRKRKNLTGSKQTLPFYPIDLFIVYFCYFNTYTLIGTGLTTNFPFVIDTVIIQQHQYIL